MFLQPMEEGIVVQIPLHLKCNPTCPTDTATTNKRYFALCSTVYMMYVQCIDIKHQMLLYAILHIYSYKDMLD